MRPDPFAAIFDEPTGRFDLLVKASGLDPRHDFKNRDLRWIDFTNSTLESFDFSDSDLRGTKLCLATSVHKSVIMGGTKLDSEDRRWLNTYLQPRDDSSFSLRMEAIKEQSNQLQIETDPYFIVLGYHSLGVDLRKLGEDFEEIDLLVESVEKLRTALEMGKKLGVNHQAINSANSLSVALGVLGSLDDDQALRERIFEEVETLSKMVSDKEPDELLLRSNKISAQVDRAEHRKDVKKIRECIDSFREIEVAYDSSPMSHDLYRTICNIAFSYERISDLENSLTDMRFAIDYFRRALTAPGGTADELFRAKTMQAFARLLMKLAEIEASPNSLEEAIQYYRSAKITAQEIGASTLHSRIDLELQKAINIAEIYTNRGSEGSLLDRLTETLDEGSEQPRVF